MSQLTPRLRTPQEAAGPKPPIILFSNLLDHVAVV
jgi:hypothetical protein